MRTRRTSIRMLVIGALAAAAALTATPVEAGSAVPSLRVPAKATLTIDGHGWGHGHGMSQYGAEGAARKGLGVQQIVRFYYPHTTAGTLGGQVTVWISGDTDQNTTILARPGLRVHDLESGSTVAVPTTGKPSTATRWRMSSGRGGATKVSYLTGAWHLWRTLSGSGEFRTTGKPLTLIVGTNRVTYRGTLRSMAPIAGHPQRITVNKVSLEGYIQGVVPREMFPSWHAAALRAQAIAARTYAAFELGSPLSARAALCDSSSCQVYGGLSAEVRSTNAAVAATKRQVREYQGKPAFTQFSSSNGGWLADGGQPYLVAKQDPYDGWSGNPVHTWSQSVTSGAIEKAYPAIGTLNSISVTARDNPKAQWGGRVLSMDLVGSKSTVSTSGDEFRSRLGLRSTWFNLSIAG